MTMRKPNYAEKMRELRNAIETTEAFMASAIREAESLDNTAKERTLTKQEYNRVQELIDFIHEKNVWLVKAKKEISSFYCPVSA